MAVRTAGTGVCLLWHHVITVILMEMKALATLLVNQVSFNCPDPQGPAVFFSS